MPPLSHTCFLFQEIRAVGAELGITPVIIRGEELKQKGFGGTVPVDVCMKTTHLSLIQIVCLFIASIIASPNIFFSLQNKHAPEKLPFIQEFMELARQQNILQH